jgi:hypothetical protein
MVVKHAEQTGVKQADNTVSPEPNIQRWEQQKQKNNANST